MHRVLGFLALFVRLGIRSFLIHSAGHFQCARKERNRKILCNGKEPCHQEMRWPQKLYMILVNENGPEGGGFISKNQSIRYYSIWTIWVDLHDPDHVVGDRSASKVP